MTHALTEAEAHKRWCPFVRYRLTGTEVSVNRDMDRPRAFGEREGDVFACMASACMAWRWSYEPDGKSQSTTKGFCGLAGT